MSDNILLDAGTNELELLIFRVSDNYYGINVAKVRSIISQVKIHSMPNMSECFEGIINLHNNILSLINLRKYFNNVDISEKSGEGIIIVIEFNNNRYGMLVDEVDKIHRLNWDQIEPPPELFVNMSAGFFEPAVKVLYNMAFTTAARCTHKHCVSRCRTLPKSPPLYDVEGSGGVSNYSNIKLNGEVFCKTFDT